MGKKKIFITGASGFIGRHLIKELNDDTYEIYALSRKVREYNQMNVIPIVGDISTLDKLPLSFQEFEICVNIAGEKRHESKMQETNVDNFKLMLSLFKDGKTKIIQISSSGVYGIESHPEVEITENSTCYPNNLYENTKYLAELELISFAVKNQMSYSILRPSNVFGEEDEQHKLLGLMKIILKNHFFLIDDNAKLNYLYVAQLTSVIKQVIEKDLFDNEIYNVNAPCSIYRFTKILNSKLGNSNSIKSFDGTLKPFVKFAVFIISKAGFFSKGKFREMTGNKYYSTEKINRQLIIDEMRFIENGLTNIVAHYKFKNLL